MRITTLALLISCIHAMKCPRCDSNKWAIDVTQHILSTAQIEPDETSRCVNTDPEYCCNVLLREPALELDELPDHIRNELDEVPVNVNIVNDEAARAHIKHYFFTDLGYGYWKITKPTEKEPPNTTGTIQFQCEYVFGDKPTARYLVPDLFTMYCVRPKIAVEWYTEVNGKRKRHVACKRPQSARGEASTSDQIEEASTSQLSRANSRSVLLDSTFKCMEIGPSA